MKILMTGGAGYLGGCMVDYLLEDGHHDITVYDSLLYEETYRKDVKFVNGDVRDYAKIKPLVYESDVVISLAALVGDGACQLNPEETMSINRDAIQWLADNFDGKIFFISSCSVYGSQNNILDESSPTNPLSLYASAKLEGEEILKDKNAIMFRLGTLFGIGDRFSRIRFDLVINTLTMKALNGGKLTVFGGDQYRPVLHVKDVARTLVENIENECTGIFNLHHENIKIIDLAEQIKDSIPGCEIVTTATSFEDARNYMVNSSKAKRDLNFTTQWTPAAGIEEMKLLLTEGRIKNTFATRYSNIAFLKELGI